MKKCILIHINDGNAEVLQNGNFMLVERFVKTEEIINKYLAQGYEVKQIIPNHSPSQQGEENMTFYKAGITIYFEKTVLDDAHLNEQEECAIADCPSDADCYCEDDDDLDETYIYDIIERYLDPESSITGSELHEILGTMERSRNMVDMMLNTVNSYEIWELYSVLLTEYKDLLTDKECATLIEKYKTIFDLPIPGKNDDEPSSEYLLTEGRLSSATKWKLIDDNSTIVISGSGATPDFYRPDPDTPWKTFKYNIKKVIFEDGITEVGMQSFYQYPNIEEVIIPESVTDIRPSVFEGCHKLKNVKMCREVFTIIPFTDRKYAPSNSIVLWSNAFFMTPWAKKNSIEWFER